MKITVFQSDKGDCLLLTSAQGANVLVDGGMRAAYQQFVAPVMGKMGKAGKKLDLVYVSHIDQDHISGVLEMLDNLVAWRVHDFQRSNGNPGHKAPSVPRPPEISAIWHNAFSTMVSENARAIGDLLAQTGDLLGLATSARVLAMAEEHRELAQSVSEAIRVSQRISGKQLGIPLNPHFNGRLAFVQTPAGPAARIGGMSFTVIGPFEEDLERLKGEWNAWLRANRDAVQDLLRRARADSGDLGLTSPSGFAAIAAASDELGDRKKVTPPNLASLMVLVQEGPKKLLLTGDGHWQDILAGLDAQSELDGQGRLHVHVLKVQHHGSEHNIHQEFCERITADHYIFCGNGKHENPDLRVVDLICSTRLAGDQRPFGLWFNCSAGAAPAGAPRTHMKQVEKLVTEHVKKAKGRVKTQFLAKPSFAINI